MPKPTPRYYWDACCWLGLVNEESAKHRELRIIWEQARRDQCELLTSAYTYIEVVKRKSGSNDPISEAESDKKIDAILEQPFVEIIQVDTVVAQLARRLRRAYRAELEQKADAIHLASALQNNVDALHTYDGGSLGGKSKLLSLSEKVIRKDGQLLKIIMPDATTDGPLFEENKDLRS